MINRKESILLKLLKIIYTKHYFFSALVVAIGFIVMFGWLMHIPLLIQLNPTFVPMQFNTALCFFCIGLSILFTYKQTRYFSSLLAFITLSIASLTLIEYIFHINLYIDELFLKHYIKTESAYPGRMGPNTAFCFLMSSISILAYNHIFKLTISKLLCIALVFIIGILGLFSLIGYFIGSSIMYKWGNITGMAVHTGFSFFLISLALFYIFLKPSLNQPLVNSTVIPSMVLGISFSLLFISWQFLAASQHQIIQKNLDNRLVHMSDEISFILSEKVYSGINLFLLIKEEENIEKRLATINSFFEINHDIILVSQNFKNNDLIYLNNDYQSIQPNKYIKECIENTKTKTSLNAFNLTFLDNKLCFSYAKSNLLMIYDVKTILNHLLKYDFEQNISIELIVNNKTLYKKYAQSHKFFTYQWKISKEIIFFGINMTVSLWPNESYVLNHENMPLLLYFLFGSVVIILFVIIVWFFQLTSLKNKELNEHKKQLQSLAYWDFLTNIPNRLQFSKLLQQSMNRARRHNTPLAILAIDLDHFKPINDQYGHNAGDLVLQIVAKRLTKAIRSSDSAARIGGDEFFILLEETDIEGAQKVATNIITDIENVISISEKNNVYISASIGIAIYPVDGSSEKDLIKYADTKLYEAKANGRGCYKF
ncbi:GGDEF domain-containing protein [Thiotrichales bacterium 19S9-12]|nr:GGDEF domain-containing protein [Thiotrichales bacterium 19S9-11]MCF6812230.1 GGDEF domain-containing protein [Thiotrichales bacterium 19S9-12]